MQETNKDVSQWVNQQDRMDGFYGHDRHTPRCTLETLREQGRFGQEGGPYLRSPSNNRHIPVVFERYGTGTGRRLIEVQKSVQSAQPPLSSHPQVGYTHR